MKMYWRQKKSIQERRGQKESESHRALRPLLPASAKKMQPGDIPGNENSHKLALSKTTASPHSRGHSLSTGLSVQLWEGVHFPFSKTLGLTKDDFPCQVTAEHRKLFYHWLAMHSEEIHSRLDTKKFSPFREIWMPLDLSNVASFNGIMAHAAADLAQTRNYRGYQQMAW